MNPYAIETTFFLIWSVVAVLAASAGVFAGVLSGDADFRQMERKITLYFWLARGGFALLVVSLAAMNAIWLSTYSKYFGGRDSPIYLILLIIVFSLLRRRARSW